jgi:hypothetical protein
MSDRNEVSAATGVSLATIAGRLERLPLTGYQRTLFLIIATAWFFDSIDLGSVGSRDRVQVQRAVIDLQHAVFGIAREGAPP